MSDNSNKLLKSFILDIIKVFPEYEKRLKKQYSKVLSEEDNCEELLSSFYENVEEIAKDLSENNFSVLDSDPIILNNVSFKIIWNSNISNVTKNNIWRYLQTFCVYNINNKQGKEDVEDVLNSIKQKEKVSDKGTLTNMKLLKKLSESLNSNIVMDLLTNKKVDVSPEKEVKNVNVNVNEKMKGIEGMKGMEDLLENSKLKVVDEQTILEISTFEAKGQTFQASVGNHDDLVMNLFLFGYFVSSAYFSNLTDLNLKDIIFNQKMKEINEDIVPFGFIDDGSEFIQKIETKDDPWQIEYDRDL